MPFETVNEQHVSQRKVLVCERCRRQMPGTVENRSAYQTGGSIGGSLAGSMGGSALAGAVLGPVGAVAGMIGGAIAGSRAGAAASDGICDAVDTSGGQLCPDCKEASTKRPAGHQNWGGGRLGASGQDSTPAQAPHAPNHEEQGMGNRISDAASKAGENLSGAASRAGENLSSMGSWLRSSVSSIGGGSGGQAPAENSTKNETFKAFAGSGHTLGSSDSSGQRSAAAEAAMRRLSGGGYAQTQTQAAPRPAPSQPQTQAVHPSQGVQPQPSDEELARQLQAQFDAEGR